MAAENLTLEQELSRKFVASPEELELVGNIQDVDVVPPPAEDPSKSKFTVSPNEFVHTGNIDEVEVLNPEFPHKGTNLPPLPSPK
ncbi:unnamed protein product [marine sediment metagenome]|uniref:Uncharacterized protein n=1 Tax=marine sediment metagenome TaxID=412755 RepID=X1AM42_9ZZZZ